MDPSDDCVEFADEYAADMARGDLGDSTCATPNCDGFGEWKYNGRWLCDACSLFALGGES